MSFRDLIRMKWIVPKIGLKYFLFFAEIAKITNQRSNGPVNAHLIAWPSKAQNIQNLAKK